MASESCLWVLPRFDGHMLLTRILNANNKAGILEQNTQSNPKQNFRRDTIASRRLQVLVSFDLLRRPLQSAHRHVPCGLVMSHGQTSAESRRGRRPAALLKAPCSFGMKNTSDATLASKALLTLYEALKTLHGSTSFDLLRSHLQSIGTYRAAWW